MEPKHLHKLTGSPGARSVSDVAMDKEPITMDEMNKAYEGDRQAVRAGDKAEVGNYDEEDRESVCKDMDEVYANLFDAVADVIRAKK